MKTKRKMKLSSLVLILMAFVLVGGFAETAYAAATALNVATNLEIKQAEAPIGVSIAVYDWYASFTPSNTAVDAAYYTETFKLYKGKTDVTSAVYSTWEDAGGGKKAARIDVPASDKYTFSVQYATKDTTRYKNSKEAKSLATVVSLTLSPIPGISINAAEEHLYFTTALAQGQDLYYRFSAVGNLSDIKATKWVSLGVAEGAKSALISKQMDRAGYLEFAIANEIPSIYDRAYSEAVFRIAERAKAPITKPKVETYAANASGGFTAFISGVNTTMAYKKATDKGYVILTEAMLSDGKLSIAVGSTATEVHLVTVPTQGSADGGMTTPYQGASKPVKVKVAALTKVPNIKVNYAKNIVTLKADAYEVRYWNAISTETVKWTPWTKVTAAALDPFKYSSTLKGLELKPEFLVEGRWIQVRLAATDKKPGSAEVYLPIYAPAVFRKTLESNTLPDLTEYLVVVNNKLVIVSGGQPFEYKSGETWKKGLPKFDKTTGIATATEIRLAASNNEAASQESFFLKADANGNLYVSATTTGVFAPCGDAPPLPLPEPEVKTVAVAISAAVYKETGGPITGDTPTLTVRYSLESAEKAKADGSVYITGTINVGVGKTLYVYATTTDGGAGASSPAAVMEAASQYTAFEGDIVSGKTVTIVTSDYAQKPTQ